ncbi:MAG TPA: hypothetical protein DIT01_07850 [Lentisphaeria bacterium]|nr:hypothetical protein [Lentisphaeria bacterium]
MGIQIRKIIGLAGLVIAVAVADAGAEWTSVEKQDGYVVFNYSNLVNLPATHVPARETIAKSLACTLASDEYESIQFGVHALTDGIEKLKVQVECDLPVTVYHRISPEIKEYFEFQPVDAAEIRGWLPSEIHLQRSNVFAALPKGNTVNFWLTFRAAADCKPGLHRGKVRIQPAGKPETVIPLAVTVRPFALQRPRVSFGMWFREDMLPKRFGGVGVANETVLKIYRDMAAHGQNACVFYPASDLHPLPPRNNHVLHKLLPLAMEAELLDPNVMSLMLGDIAPDNSPEKLKESIDWLLAETPRRGWPEFAGFAADEPDYPSDLVVLRKACAKYRGLNRRMSVDLADIVSFYGYSIPNLCDVLSVGEGLVTPEAAAETKRLGADLLTFSFTIWREGHDPLKERFFAGFFTWTHELQGNWIWAYHHIHHRHAWFPPDSQEPMPVTGWEARREGIDDYRYLQMLEDGIAANRDTPVAVEAAAWLTELRSRLRLVQPLKVAAGKPLATDEFDAIREQAADYITKLEPLTNTPEQRRPLARVKDEAATYRGKTVAACLLGTTRSDTAERRAAVWALYEMGDKAWPAAKRLATLLNDPDTRMPALHALEAIGPRAWQTVPVIAKLLEHPDPYVRIGAIMALGGIGCPVEKYKRNAPHIPSNHATAIVEPLAIALEDTHPDITRRVAEMLGVMGPLAKPAMPAVARALDNSAPSVRQAMLALIKRLGEHAAPVAAKLSELHAENPDKMEIINALAAIGPAATDALPALREYAARTNPNISHTDSYCAIFCITGDAEDLQPMITLLKNPNVGADTKNHLVKRLEELGIRTAPIADELRELTKDGEFVDEQKESGFGATPPKTARYIDGAKCRDLVPKLEVVARLPLEGWRFKADPKGIGTAKGFYKPDFPSDDLTSIRISEFWDTQGYKNLGEGWYRLQYKCPALPDGKRVFVLFEAVDEGAFLYIDGKLVAWYDTAFPHTTWSKPFLLDVTGSLQSGSDHLLAIRVHNYSGDGGLYKPVSIMAEK